MEKTELIKCLRIDAGFCDKYSKIIADLYFDRDLPDYYLAILDKVASSDKPSGTVWWNEKELYKHLIEIKEKY